MNIAGIGTDIVAIARIKAIWKRFGLDFAQRILTPLELEELKSIKDPIAFLAKRYAAKEAVSKALGTGFRPHGIVLRDIGVSHDALGRPHLHFLGRAKEVMQANKVVDSHISISDEREFALAFVLLVG